MSKNESDLNQILKKRIEGIQQEMSKIYHFINDFVKTADSKLINLVVRLTYYKEIFLMLAKWKK